MVGGEDTRLGVAERPDSPFTPVAALRVWRSDTGRVRYRGLSLEKRLYWGFTPNCRSCATAGNGVAIAMSSNKAATDVGVRFRVEILIVCDAPDRRSPLALAIKLVSL